jgi:hypothetical protein
MKTITLTVQEFINFKSIYKGVYLSKVENGDVKVTANATSLSYFGY